MAADPDQDYSVHTGDDEEDMLAQLRRIGTSSDEDSTAGRIPSLGEDNFDIRFKNLTPNAKPDGSIVLDLNNAEHLARSGLEDPNLIKRMEDAREGLRLQKEKSAQIAALDEIRKQDITARRALSTLITGLVDQKMGLQNVSEEVVLHLTNIDRLRTGTPDGKPPHGYPAGCQGVDTNASANLGHLSKKLTETSKALNVVLESLSGFERELTLTRRNYEQVVDGLYRRVEEPVRKAHA